MQAGDQGGNSGCNPPARGLRPGAQARAAQWGSGERGQRRQAVGMLRGPLGASLSSGTHFPVLILFLQNPQSLPMIRESHSDLSSNAFLTFFPQFVKYLHTV